MRSFGTIVSMCILTLLTASVSAQNDAAGGDDPGDIFAKPDSGDTAEETEADAPKKNSSGSSEMVMDAETIPQEDGSGQLVDADFLSLGGTAAWLDRNGLGAHAAVGGYTCAREYCNTILDVSILGSIAGTLGAFYKLNPNWSFFADLTFARLNTNFRDGGSDYNVADDNHGFVFSFLLGPSFHLPVKGWLDIYTNIGLGPVFLKETISGDEAHRWGGIDFQWGLGADLYFWSVGALKNFAIGPYMSFGFPIWIKTCDIQGGMENCKSPSELNDDTDGDLYFNEKPIFFQLGIEAKLHFSIGGKKDTPTSMEVTTKPASKEDNAKDGEEKEAAEKDGEDADADNADADADAGAEADADAGGDANWDM
ncbi:MAG: hypothetical protein JXX29_18875 [Deltaproteobacteria bacterium]|nr:hypothetical protein [Deltaproteobacteria bacterium]MBN2673750.1 hypothetical protein [Deltaproteobacteria bacterium]